MNTHKKTVRDVEVRGKKVLLRCDFNVPQDKETGAITSDKRIVAALPTIQYLLENGAAVIACSHLGKPKNGPDPKLSLAPVAKRLSELLGREVIFAHDVVGPDAQTKAAALQPGQILLLENTASSPARPRTTRSWPGSWPTWRICMCPTPSVPCTGPTPPPPAWRRTCPPSPAS